MTALHNFMDIRSVAITHVLLFQMSGSEWQELGLGFTLRCWQNRATERLTKQIKNGARSICLVAPPGSGKTVCALAVAQELELFVEVRVPTTALVEQWTQQINSILVSIHSTEVERPFRVATYASQTPYAEHALLIMDEAHHLTAAWGKRLKDEWNPEQQILFGLTATPPYDSTGWSRFVEIFGEDPIEIPAPPLVREMQLSPFLDLVWPTLADANDLPELSGCAAQLKALSSELGAPFRLWQHTMLAEHWWQLTEERFVDNSGLLVALCRLRNEQGLELPLDILPEAEFIELPTLEDRALAIWSFAQEDQGTMSRLRKIGFVLRKHGPVLKDDIAWSALSRTDARVKGALDVLALEARIRSEFLRALVVCNRDVEGDILSARQMLKALVSDPRTERLEPILVSGTVFWADEDIYSDVFERFAESSWVKKDNHYELDVRGWSTAERVSLATKLLTSGVTQCLVGTRHLLGEGWDCPAVNCVIDVTGISASVTVNQIRGRGLRRNPDDPAKITSLWDVISLAPGVSNGDRMLKQLRKRHQHTFGIDAQGRIRSGLDRIDPILSRPFYQIIEDVDALQERMKARAENLWDCMQHWAVGESYLDAKIWTVEHPEDWTSRPPTLPRKHVQAEHKAGPSSFQLRSRRYGIGTFLALSACVSALFSLESPLGLGVGATLCAMLAVGLFLRRPTSERTALIMQTVHVALLELNPALGELKQEDGKWWVESKDHGEEFAVAAQMLLGAVRYPRYLLIEGDGSVYAVPEQLAGQKKVAERFAALWSERIAACTVVYARSEKGKRLLREVWRSVNNIQPSLNIVESWE